MLERIREVLPVGAMLAGGEIDGSVGRLFADEEARARTMSAGRRREFAAGRHYARDAMRALGVRPASIPVGASRAPDWPAGIVGAISHSRQFCAAVVARRSRLGAIGLDIESADLLPPEMVPLVCRPADCRDRASLEAAVGVDLPKLVFVLKETFFKAYFPVTSAFLEFSDVEIALDPSRSVFQAHLVDPRRPACLGSRTLSGRFGSTRDMLFAVAWLAAPVHPA